MSFAIFAIMRRRPPMAGFERDENPSGQAGDRQKLILNGDPRSCDFGSMS